MAPKLSVIIPAYNEAKRLGPHLNEVVAYLKTNYPGSELIIVDDGSTDETASVVKKHKVKLISYLPNRGKGYAIRTGVSATTGEMVLFMDADLSTPLTEIPKIIKVLGNNDIVIGSRGKSDAPFYRQIASFIFDQIKFIMVGLRRFKDTQCGFKIFKGDVARRLFAKGQIDRYMFDAEILYMAERSGLTIVELPISWADVPGSHVRFWEGLINMFRDLWRIRQLHS